jgi:site-specific DNA-cytosine methylase
MDILEDGFVDRDKSHCLDANYFKGGNLKSYFEKNRRQLVFDKPFQINPSKDASGRQPYMQDRVFDVRGKSHALTASFADRTKVGSKVMDKLRGDNASWRKLTPVECERLQTVPEGYTNHVSDTQRYKMLGNGWTVDVIAHIFGGML